MELDQVLADVAEALQTIDSSRVPFRGFQPGVGPYAEPQLVKAVAAHLNALPAYGGAARTQRTPDLLLPRRWALEFKITRPFGDNGKEAENWSVNLLHPYEGSTSVIGDCLKLEQLDGSERKAAIVIGYEHSPPQISLAPLLKAFEVVATSVIGLNLGPRRQIMRTGLVHPVHQQFSISSWEVLRRVV